MPHPLAWCCLCVASFAHFPSGIRLVKDGMVITYAGVCQNLLATMGDPNLIQHGSPCPRSLFNYLAQYPQSLDGEALGGASFAGPSNVALIRMAPSTWLSGSLLLFAKSTALRVLHSISIVILAISFFFSHSFFFLFLQGMSRLCIRARLLTRLMILCYLVNRKLLVSSTYGNCIVSYDLSNGRFIFCALGSPPWFFSISILFFCSLVMMKTSLSVVAGQCGVDGSSDGEATNATFSGPGGMTVVKVNSEIWDLYIMDIFNWRVRKLVLSAPATELTAQTSVISSSKNSSSGAVAAAISYPSLLSSCLRVLSIIIARRRRTPTALKASS